MSDKKNFDIPVTGDVSQKLDNFESWIIDNNKIILAICGGIVVIVAVVASILFYMDGQEARNRKAYAAADTPEKLETALAEHGSGPAADEARMRLAGLLSAKKDYLKAAGQYQLIVSDGKAASFLRGRASVEAGIMYELAGKSAEAEAVFRKASDDPAFEEDLRAEASYSLGRLLAAKKDYAGARLAFKRANLQNPSTQSARMWSSLANASMNRLPPQTAAAPAPAK